MNETAPITSTLRDTLNKDTTHTGGMDSTHKALRHERTRITRDERIRRAEEDTRRGGTVHGI